MDQILFRIFSVLTAIEFFGGILCIICVGFIVAFVRNSMFEAIEFVTYIALNWLASLVLGVLMYTNGSLVVLVDMCVYLILDSFALYSLIRLGHRILFGNKKE